MKRTFCQLKSSSRTLGIWSNVPQNAAPLAVDEKLILARWEAELRRSCKRGRFDADMILLNSLSSTSSGRVDSYLWIVKKMFACVCDRDSKQTLRLILTKFCTWQFYTVCL